jgi:hypothetical protein
MKSCPRFVLEQLREMSNVALSRTTLISIFADQKSKDKRNRNTHMWSLHLGNATIVSQPLVRRKIKEQHHLRVWDMTWATVNQ